MAGPIPARGSTRTTRSQKRQSDLAEPQAAVSQRAPRARAYARTAESSTSRSPAEKAIPIGALPLWTLQSARVLRWIDLRPQGDARDCADRHEGLSVKHRPSIPRPYAVVLNQYGNFASVIDTATDTVIGEFETGFYGEKVVFNRQRHAALHH